MHGFCLNLIYKLKGVINCVHVAPNYESIKILKNHRDYAIVPWNLIKHIDKKTFTFIREKIVRKEEDFPGLINP